MHSFRTEIAAVRDLVLLALWGALGFHSTYLQAFESNITPVSSQSTLLFSQSATERLFSIHPIVGRQNQPRTVFLQIRAHGCDRYDVTLDTSTLESQSLVKLNVILRTDSICPTIPPDRILSYTFEFTPTKVGPIRVVSDVGGTVIVQSLSAAVTSMFNVNGMWFSSSTNGSGLALHHSRNTTDAVFGTWFLFNNNGETRWYTMQSANWLEDGSVLEGLLIQMRGGCASISLAACPAPGSFGSNSLQNQFAVMPAKVRITFQSSTRGQANVLSLGGALLFTSDLTKLEH